METVLLDTNLISFIFKNDTRAKEYSPFLKGNLLAISFMTVAELYQWGYVHNWQKKRIDLMQEELKKYLVLPFDVEICRLWGEISSARQKIGKPISPQDAFIAASAIRHDIQLITHNPTDFQMIDKLVLKSILPAS